MKAPKTAWIAPLVLVSVAAFAQEDSKAVPRTSSGGGSSTSSSQAGSRHSGGSSSSSGASSSAGSDRQSNSSPGRVSEGSSAPAAAGRRPRPGTGTGDRDRYGTGRDRYVQSPYSGYYYNPYSYSYGYPRSRSYGYYGYGYGYSDYGYSYGDYYGYYPSYGYRTYRYREGNVSQIRTLVDPAKTRVYVDGYYAGIADDFDGLLQRLNVAPGRHEISLKLEGYSSHVLAIYAGREQTLKLRWDMVRGTGETRDSIGDVEDHSERDSNRARDLELDRPSEDRYSPPSRESGRGEVLLDIEPADASVYVDGEFYGKASEATRLDLPAGRHRIEVVRPGYRTEETEVVVERDSKRVAVKLDRR